MCCSVPVILWRELTPFCYVILLLTRMLWNSVNNFSVFPCFWHWWYFFKNRSTLLLMFYTKKIFPKFFVEMHPFDDVKPLLSPSNRSFEEIRNGKLHFCAALRYTLLPVFTRNNILHSCTLNGHTKRFTSLPKIYFFCFSLLLICIVANVVHHLLFLIS